MATVNLSKALLLVMLCRRALSFVNGGGHRVGSFATATGSRCSVSTIFSSFLDRELKELDRARAAFEAMFWKEQEKDSSKGNRATAILTSAGRHRRNLEIMLLETLRDSNGAVDELMNLWMYERDSESAAALVEMQDECSAGLVKEEAALRVMIEENPNWAEPCSRLAALLFFKGRAMEAYQMAERTLELKPWHFEAMQLLLMISLRNQDMNQALYWGRRALPTLKEEEGKANKRRRAWVDEAVRQAHEQFKEVERASIEKSFSQIDSAEEIWQ